MKRVTTFAAAIALVVGLAPMPSRAATVQVFMSNLQFCNTPVCVGNQNTTIKVGDTVQWIYTDAMCTAFVPLGCKHTVSASNFDSGDVGVQNATLTFERKFNSTGTVAYHCEVHLTMKASIIVTN